MCMCASERKQCFQVNCKTVVFCLSDYSPMSSACVCACVLAKNTSERCAHTLSDREVVVKLGSAYIFLPLVLFD